MLGVRQKKAYWLVCAITALAISFQQSDHREILMDISLIYHSALKIGDPKSIFEEGLKNIDTPKIRQLILGYLKRKPPYNCVSKY